MKLLESLKAINFYQFFTRRPSYKVSFGFYPSISFILFFISWVITARILVAWKIRIEKKSNFTRSRKIIKLTQRLRKEYNTQYIFFYLKWYRPFEANKKCITCFKLHKKFTAAVNAVKMRISLIHIQISFSSLYSNYHLLSPHVFLIGYNSNDKPCHYFSLKFLENIGDR